MLTKTFWMRATASFKSQLLAPLRKFGTMRGVVSSAIF